MYVRSFIFFVSLALVESAKVLVVFAVPSVSHQIVFRPFIQELVNRHHEVTVMTTDPAYASGKSPKHLREIDLHNLSYTSWEKLHKLFANNNQDSFLSVMTATIHTAHEIFYKQLQDESVLKLIKKNGTKFDVLILEECVAPALIFSYIFKAPVILISSFGDNWGKRNVIGALTHPFLYPPHFHRRIYNLTIWEKISELYHHIQYQWMHENLVLQDDKRLQNIFGVDTPSLHEMKNNISALFLNTNPHWFHNQPVPMNLVYCRGIHRTPEKLLPEDLQAYLNSSKNGVIYISFGTNYKTSMLQPETLKILLNVFSRLPYNIIWKWDTDELPGKSDNIKISKWLPQSDILRHPNMKLFITHGGLQSTEEAISAGVPLIGVPLFADQHYNTEKYVHFKIGLQLQLRSLTIDKFENAIKTVLTNYDSYKKNIIHLRTHMQERPEPPLENAIWWVEYVLRHGGARHLSTTAANMSWTEYYELELILFTLSGLIILVTAVILILRSGFKLLLVCNIKNKIAKCINYLVTNWKNYYQYRLS